MNFKPTSLIYNEEFKLKFLENFSQSQDKTNNYRSAFRKSYHDEVRLGKDIYDFTAKELDEFFAGAKFKTSASAKNVMGSIKEYILICVAEGFSNLQSDRNISLLSSDVNKYVYSNMRTFYTFDDLEIGFSKDSEFRYLMAMLMMHGVGAKNFKEVQGLKVEHLIISDDEYLVKLPTRTVSIPKDLYERLISFNNVKHDPAMKYGFIEDSEYIFKAFDSPFKSSGIRKFINDSQKDRINTNIREVLNDDTIGLKTYCRSGCSYYAYKYMVESGHMTLTIDILKKVGARFNLTRNSTNHFYIDKILEQLNIEFMKKEYGDFSIEQDILSRLKKSK